MLGPQHDPLDLAVSSQVTLCALSPWASRRDWVGLELTILETRVLIEAIILYQFVDRYVVNNSIFNINKNCKCEID